MPLDAQLEWCWTVAMGLPTWCLSMRDTPCRTPSCAWTWRAEPSPNIYNAFSAGQCVLFPGYELILMDMCWGCC